MKFVKAHTKAGNLTSIQPDPVSPDKKWPEDPSKASRNKLIFMPNRQLVKDTLNIYAAAWQTRDSNLILTIFTPDARYQEGPFAKAMVGHREIKAYWDKKVVKEQKNIKPVIKNFLIEGDQCAVEWHAEFDDLAADQRIKMYEVMFLKFRDGKISSLRESWVIERKWGPGRFKRLAERIRRLGKI